jgi:drug/metabolite transporter (DMT)-like permease
METTTERLRGTVLVCSAAFCWSLGGIFVRLIGDHLDSWTIAFWRSAFMVLAVGGWLFGSNGCKVLALYRAMGWTGVVSGCCWPARSSCSFSGSRAPASPTPWSCRARRRWPPPCSVADSTARG